MVIKFDVSVDNKNILKRLNRIEKEIKETKSASVEQIGRLTRDYLKLYMPKSVGGGESARSIQVIKRVNTKNYSYVQVGLGFKPHPDRIGSRGYNGKWFNLPLWVKTSNRALTHFKSGNVQSFRNVPKEMQRRFFRKVKMDLRKILK